MNLARDVEQRSGLALVPAPIAGTADVWILPRAAGHWSMESAVA